MSSPPPSTRIALRLALAAFALAAGIAAAVIAIAVVRGVI